MPQIKQSTREKNSPDFYCTFLPRGRIGSFKVAKFLVVWKLQGSVFGVYKIWERILFESHYVFHETECAAEEQEFPLSF